MADKEYAEIISKLDDLLTKQNAMLLAQAVINSRVESQERVVSDLSSLVRGGPGITGLVTDIAVIKNMLRDICDSDFCKKQKSDAITIPLRDNRKDEEEGKSVSWRWVIDKAIVPVITGFLLWFLLDVLPDLLVYMNTGSKP